MAEQRETLATGLGFLLVSAGCAVGLGNVWRFPFIVGQNGGALFVALYVLFLIVFGLPMMVTEFAIGRASQRSLNRAYTTLCPKTRVYRVVGPIQVAGNWLLMMFYTTVAGWMLAYPVAILSGWFDFTEPKAFFDGFVASPTAQLFWMTMVSLIGFGVCALGLEKGVEAVTKKMMIALFVLLVGLCVYVLTLDGAGAGVSFYLKPNLAVLEHRPLFNIIFDALGQSFFTLSLGIGSMAIFGSYTSRTRTLPGESAKIIAIDTFVALLAGLIIFPACFAYNVKPDAGPSLIFVTLPKVFANMAGGQWVGAAFFVFLGLAAITTVIAVFENIIATTMDARGCTRWMAIRRNAPFLFLLSLPCTFGSNLLRSITPMGAGSSILDLEDFVVSNLMLPLGALAILIFCVSRRFWGWEAFQREANTGRGLRLPNALRFYMTYILPVVMLFVFVGALVTKFVLD
ncbi:MAG: sodium-dependent transporter [Kiritimatiellia bacterium]